MQPWFETRFVGSVEGQAVVGLRALATADVIVTLDSFNRVFVAGADGEMTQKAELGRVGWIKPGAKVGFGLIHDRHGERLAR